MADAVGIPIPMQSPDSLLEGGIQQSYPALQPVRRARTVPPATEFRSVETARRIPLVLPLSLAEMARGIL